MKAFCRIMVGRFAIQLIPKPLALIALVALVGCAVPASDSIPLYLHARLSPAIIGQPVEVAVKAEGGVPTKWISAGADSEIMEWQRVANGWITEGCTETITVQAGRVTAWDAKGECSL